MILKSWEQTEKPTIKFWSRYNEKIFKMKKLFLLLVLSNLLFSCGVDHANYKGKWVDKKYEKEIVIIEKNGKNYLVQIYNNEFIKDGERFPAQIKDGLLEISTGMGMPVKATIDNNDILIISGKEYIRYEKSKKH